jgi:phage tail-like protein
MAIMTPMTRYDPYKNFKFRLQVGNAAYSGSGLTGVVSALAAVQAPAEYREGDNNTIGLRKGSGRTAYDPIVLSRGVVQDSSFSSWASQVMGHGSSLGTEVSLANFRKNLFIEFYDEAGTLVVQYELSGLTVSETPKSPPGATRQYYLSAGGAASVDRQLATIFENALRRLRP